ncbi:MarR family transcriptional regulator [Holzapfeliella sp. He02]|uniref:MarR family transcriptional regulator n=1 Tax=Holzapfeliella saturejae TaxID=3082953 RepID=A0ABU8SEJ5_9LACO
MENKENNPTNSSLEVVSILMRVLFHNMKLNGSLSRMQLLTCFVVIDEKKVKMSRLADLIGISRVQVSHLVKSLEEQNIVARKTNPDNRRVVEVEMTQYGYDYVHEQSEEWRQNFEKEMASVSKTDLAELDQHLSQAVEILKRNGK